MTLKQEVAQLLNAATSGRLDVSWLFGPAKRGTRQIVVSAIAGTKVPLSKCGIHAMMDALYGLYGTEGDCIRAREEELAHRIRAELPAGTVGSLE